MLDDADELLDDESEDDDELEPLSLLADEPVVLLLDFDESRLSVR